MRFFLDHDVPFDVARVLRAEGHDVTELREVLAINATDEQAFDYARKNDLLTITCNRDDLLKLAAAAAHPGLIVLIRRRTRVAECANLLKLISRAGDSGLAGNINFA